MATDNVLLILEGKSTEPNAIRSIIKAYKLDFNKVEVIFESDVYQLYSIFHQDEDLDVVEVLRERSEENKKTLLPFDRDDFSQIYIFFDYEGHATKAQVSKIEELLNFFDNETEQGKLYISYPMVEAFRHLTDDFCNLQTPIALGKKYKNDVANSDSKFRAINYSKMNSSVWNEIVLRTIRKIFLIKSNKCSPDSYQTFRKNYEQLAILNLQKKFIKFGNVSVLSALPFFILEYLGENLYRDLSSKSLSCVDCRKNKPGVWIRIMKKIINYLSALLYISRK